MLARYYQRMQQQYGRLELDTLTPPQDQELLRIQLRSVFVEPSVRVDPPPVELPKEWWERLQIEGEIGADDLPEGVGHEDLRRVRELWRAKPPRRVLEVLTDPAEEHVVLLGDPGAGKSTLARYLVLSLAAPGVDGQLSNLEGYLPLLIELRDFAALLAKGKCETSLDYLSLLGRTEGYGLDLDALNRHLLYDGRAVVIFDGLDELFDPSERETVTRQIAGFALAYPLVRLLVTSRIIGYRRTTLTDAGFAHYTLQDLDEPRIEEFLMRWYGLAFG